jgi:alkylation response protein AidB-like acyl-CoA dehydrogenase
VNLALSEEQLELQSAVRQFVAGRFDPEGFGELTDKEPGYDPDVWRTLVDAGWARRGFPTAVGGSGGGLTDLVVVVEEIGRGPLPCPVQNGVVQSGFALVAVGDEEHGGRHLSELLSGRRRYAFCLTEPSGSYRPEAVVTRATRHGGGWRLDGAKSFVPYGQGADRLLVVARTGDGPAASDGLSLFVVDAAGDGVSRKPFASIGCDRQCRIDFDAVRVDGDDLIGAPGRAWPRLRAALDRAAVVVAAEAVGAAAAALDAAVGRAQARLVFGAPLGSYQGMQHRFADRLIDLTAARDAVYDAAGGLDRAEDARLRVSSAKVAAAEGGRRVTAFAHQVHGGEGIYADRPVHLWYRRVKGLEPVLGDPRWHRERIAALVFGR